MSAGALDRLAGRMQSMALYVQENVGSGVERFRVSMVNPFRITELGGELVLEDGDPDFTIGETLRGAITAGDVQTGHLIWVARDEQEWHAFDVVGDATTGTARDATSLRGRAVSNLAPSTGQALLWTGSQWAPASLPSSSPPSGAAGGALRGTYPNPAAIVVAAGSISHDTANVALTNATASPDYTARVVAYLTGGMTASNAGLVIPKDGVYWVSHSVRCDTSAAATVQASVTNVQDFFIRITPAAETVRILVAGPATFTAGTVCKPTYTANPGTGTFFRSTSWGNWLTATYIGPSA